MTITGEQLAYAGIGLAVFVMGWKLHPGVAFAALTVYVLVLYVAGVRLPWR